MINVENINFKYKAYKQILFDVGFNLNKGEFLGILGNNGVGKSTLLKCFNHILTPISGKISIDDKDLLHMSYSETAKQVAFVSQNIPSTQMTVHDVVMLGRKPYMKWGFTEKDHEIIHHVMDRLGIVGDMQGRFLNQLSGGERQKVMLARALAQEPKLLLLDEPTSSLDIKNQYQVLKIVRDICKSDNISAIIVIHDLNLALKFCDKFLLLKEGKVFKFGDVSILDRKALKEVYDIDGKIVNVEGQNTVIVEE